MTYTHVAQQDEVIFVGRNDQRSILVPSGITNCEIRGAGGTWASTLEGHCRIEQAEVSVRGVNFRGGLHLAGSYWTQLFGCWVTGGDFLVGETGFEPDPAQKYHSELPSAIDFHSLRVTRVHNIQIRDSANLNFFGGAFERWTGAFSVGNDRNYGPILFFGTRFETDDPTRIIQAEGYVRAERPTMVCAQWHILRHSHEEAGCVGPVLLEGAAVKDYRPRRPISPPTIRAPWWRGRFFA